MNPYKPDPPHDPCLSCGRPIRRHLGEAIDNFHKRKCCDSVCSANRRSELAAARREASDARRAAEAAAMWVDRLPDDRQAGLSGLCYARYELRFRPASGRVAQPETVVASGSTLDGK